MLKAAQLALKPFVLLEKVVDSGQHLLVLAMVDINLKSWGGYSM